MRTQKEHDELTNLIRDSGRQFRDIALEQAIEICEQMAKQGWSAAACAGAIRKLRDSLPRPGDNGTMLETEH